MKNILLLSAVLFAFSANAQNLHLTAFGGFANYQGDLQEKKFTSKQGHPAFGAGLLYEISDHFDARLNATMGKIGADDKLGTKNKDRNLSFSSPITDVHLGLEYNFLNIYDKGFTPYIFAGISYFHFKPSTIDSTGNKVYLQPLGTEGQGFYDGREKYKLGQFSLPFGAGIKLALGDNVRVGLEAGMRKTNTDYLDDVSKTFADQNQLLAHNGQQAVSLAYRGDEVKSGTGYPAEGAQRGSPKYKDWYYFTGVTFSIRLQGNKAGRKSGYGCPVNVR